MKKNFNINYLNFRFLLVITSFFLIRCGPGGEPSCLSVTYYKNKSGQDIKIESYFKSGIKDSTILLPNNEMLTFKNGGIGFCGSVIYILTSDSISVVFNDSIRITHGSKSGIDSCNGRNLRCSNSFDRRQIEEDYNEYTYTFTEEDYEFAKNR